MNSTALLKRRQELQLHCEQQKINWKESVKNLPNDDDGVILAALATALKFSLRGAFDPSKSLADLESERKIAENEAKQLDDLRRRLAP